MADEINGFRPVGSLGGIYFWVDDAALRRAAFDVFGKINRANFLDGFNHLARGRRPAVRILFVEIKAVGFPVLVQAEIKIKRRLPLQPRDVRAGPV